MHHILEMRKLAAVVTAAMLLSFVMPMSGCKGLEKRTYGYSWEKRFQGEELSLVDVSILDESHIWAIDWVDEINGLFSKAPYFDGEAWDKQYSFQGSMLCDIYAYSPKCIWAVGVKKIAEEEYTGTVYYFDGVSWKTEIENRWPSGLISVFLLDENHIWATAKGIYFFDGSQWSQQLGSEERFQAICATRHDDVWAVNENGTVYHFDGSGWDEQQQLTFPNEVFFISYARMHALDENNVWATLYDAETEITRIFFFDGSSWEEQLSLPRTLVVTGIYALDEKHVWASCGGGLEGPFPILFYDGREWSIQQEYDESLIGIRAMDENNVFAVGESGGIYKGTKY